MRRFPLFLYALAACAAAAQASNGGTLTAAIYDDPQDLNPLIITNGAASAVTSLIYNGLAHYDDKMRLVPELAEGWEISPDGMSWTVHLRSGVKFSDGSRLTADDVAASLKWATDPKNRGVQAGQADYVKSVQIPDARTIRLVFASANPSAESILTVSIVPARKLRAGDSAADLARNALGTGPFRLREHEPGQLVFDANPMYLQGRPYLDRIVLKVFPDQKSAWVALMQGEIELVTDIDYEDCSVVENDSRFTVADYLDFFCYAVFFNLKDPLLSQTPIRRAISAGIDRGDLVNKVLLGAGTPSTGPFRPSTWAYDPDPTLQAFDPARARRILADLGWKDSNGDWILDKDGKPLRFTMVITEGDRTSEDTAKRLQWQLLQVGIQMNVDPQTMEVAMQDTIPKGKFQAILLPANAGIDPDGVATRFWHSSSIGRLNISSYSNAAVDRLIDQGKTTLDLNRRAVSYHEIHRIISTDVPAAFLFFKKRYVAMTSRLRGVTDSHAGFFDSTVYQWYLAQKT